MNLDFFASYLKDLFEGFADANRADDVATDESVEEATDYFSKFVSSVERSDAGLTVEMTDGSKVRVSVEAIT